MGVIFGLLAALAWGVADFGTANLTRQIGVLRALAWTQIISGAIILTVMLVMRPALPMLTIVMVLVGMGTAQLLGTLLLYRAFAIGTLAVVGPISASYALVEAGLSLASGSEFSLLLGAGVLCVVGGIALVTQQRGKTSLAGVPEALVGALGFGLVFWSLKQVEDKAQLGYLWPLFALRLAAFSGSYALLSLSNREAREHGESGFLSALRAMPWSPRAKISGTLRTQLARPWIIGVALLDTSAWAFVSGGYSLGNSTIVTALSSLSHAATVFLAWLLLHDKLSLVQWSGVVVLLLGVFLLSF